MNRAKLLPFWVLTIALFIFLLCPNLLRDGMFVDGLWYATIANNLAQGIGSFWSPQLTETIFPQFHEHPPLLFWIQAVFFRVLGDGMFTERFYCFLVAVCTAFTLHFLWKFIYKNDAQIKYLSFLPMLFWLLNEDVILSYPNNLLECTMTLFTSFSVFILLIFMTKEGKSQNKLHNWSLIIIAGGLTYLAFLTKGLVGLFPLAFFAVHWLAFRTISLRKTLLYSLLLTGSFVAFLLITLLFEEAYNALSTYFNKQVVAALQGERTENIRASHFYILKRLLEKNLGMIAIAGVFILGFQYFKIPFLTKKDRPWIAFLLLIGIAASFPLMISIKQASYYLLPSLPFYCTAFAILISRGFTFLIEKMNVAQAGYKIFTMVSVLFLGYAIYYSFSQLGKIDKRDLKLLSDVRIISTVVPSGTTINSRIQKFDRSLHGYFQRYYFISLDESKDLTHDYLLIEKELDSIPLETYRRIELPLTKYTLYTTNQ